MNQNISSDHMLTISGISCPVFPRPILPAWIEIAGAKGFDIAGRIIDRLHLALRCRVCGAVHKSRLYTLISAQPLCPSCLEREWRKGAEAAGLQFLHRDPDDRHYALYRAPCGHDLRRQTGLIRRMAAGETGMRCEICHAETEADEARTRGWTLIGPDPAGNPHYRIYRHDLCGRTQRIARANMQTGRFGCPHCDAGWVADPSWLYLMRFTLASSREVIKLGYSRDPVARLSHQLKVDPEMPCEIMRMVPMASGHAAIRAEKRMHGTLKCKFPHAIVDRSAWSDQIRVKSEIYDAELTPVILDMLDRAEAKQRR